VEAQTECRLVSSHGTHELLRGNFCEKREGKLPHNTKTLPVEQEYRPLALQT